MYSNFFNWIQWIKNWFFFQIKKVRFFASSKELCLRNWSSCFLILFSFLKVFWNLPLWIRLLSTSDDLNRILLDSLSLYKELRMRSHTGHHIDCCCMTHSLKNESQIVIYEKKKFEFLSSFFINLDLPEVSYLE